MLYALYIKDAGEEHDYARPGSNRDSGGGGGGHVGRVGNDGGGAPETRPGP